MAKRLLSGRPRPEWGWTEGDDARISWKELSAFAQGLEADDGVGGDDGFVRLANTSLARRNLQALDSAAPSQ